MSWRTLLINRFTLTFGGIAVVAIAWNIFVAFNNGGKVSGRVIDGRGEGVANAVVTLFRKTVASVEPIGETTTGPDGQFVFRDHGQFSLILEVEAASGNSERVTVPLLFRNQDVTLSVPLAVEG